MHTYLGGLAANHGITLTELLQAFDELWQVSTVLDVDSHTHHGGHGELHGLDAASGLAGCDGAGLKEKRAGEREREVST